MKSFQELKKIGKHAPDNLPTVKLAVLADSASQLLCMALKGSAVEHGFKLDLWEADYNQIDLQLMNPASEYHEFKADYTLIFQSSHKLLNEFRAVDAAEKSTFAEKRLNTIANYCNSCEGKLIYCDYTELNDNVFGSYGYKVESSSAFQLRKLNYKLSELALTQPNLYICSLSDIQNRLGRDTTFDVSIYTSTEMVLSVDSLPWVASRVCDVIAALKGKAKKCLILDLDNTLWGGVVGDDGWENLQLGHGLGIGKAFSEFQAWIKQLKERGIILAVCSKNDEAIAREAFEKNPEMVLQLDDFAMFVANWNNKADNIRHIQHTLNIGFDSMVFIDDNPFERNMVRDNIPDITVPEMPVDPADYLEYLYGLNLFEAASYSSEDAARTKQYQVEAQRSIAQQQFANEDDFLQSLSMEALVEGFNKFNIPRVAQLTQRSNQFNLRTIRYDEADISRMASDSNYVCMAFSLCDKFGDNGLISVVIMQKEDNNTLFINTWLMSCRVLKRGMESFVTNAIAEYASQHGYKQIIGEYLPSPKNKMVANHYPALGFESIGDGRFRLNVDKFTPLNNHITSKHA